MRHRRLMLQPFFIALEGSFQRKDRLAVLDGDHPAGGEAAAVANPVDLVDDWQLGVAGPHEIAMQRMHVPVGLHRALRGDERLGDGLAAEHALPVHLGTATTVKVVFQLLQVENGEKLLHGRRHLFAPFLEQREPGPVSIRNDWASQGGREEDGRNGRSTGTTRKGRSTFLSPARAMSALAPRFR